MRPIKLGGLLRSAMWYEQVRNTRKNFLQWRAKRDFHQFARSSSLVLEPSFQEVFPFACCSECDKLRQLWTNCLRVWLVLSALSNKAKNSPALSEAIARKLFLERYDWFFSFLYVASLSMDSRHNSRRLRHLSYSVRSIRYYLIICNNNM